ncbi:MAG: Rrf2 family transcriptional regulator [Actinobacteria bacterium]|nr:Rrf2 family transcriptional regulator [Actinomycetota bacterium]
MVRLSTRSRYGLRALLYLSSIEDDRLVPLSQIAAAEQIPAPFLERILGRLREAGLVTARRGVAGGYRLARAPGEVTVADVVSAVEDPRPLLDCLERPDVCGRIGTCRARKAWSRLDEAIAGALAGVTLGDLLEEDVSL